MDKIICFKEFIETGKLGMIELGQNKYDIINYLGNEYDIGDFGDTVILKYSLFEFFFYKNILYGIQNDSINYIDKINNTIGNYILDMWFLYPGITLKETKNKLKNENIKFVEESEDNINNCIKIIFEKNVYIEYYNETINDEIIEDKEKYIFYTIRIFNNNLIK
jgi:hypothetical protein